MYFETANWIPWMVQANNPERGSFDEGRELRSGLRGYRVDTVDNIMVSAV